MYLYKIESHSLDVISVSDLYKISYIVLLYWYNSTYVCTWYVMNLKLADIYINFGSPKRKSMQLRILKMAMKLTRINPAFLKL